MSFFAILSNGIVSNHVLLARECDILSIFEYTSFMTKKQFVLQVLESLLDKWALAKDLRKFLLIGALDDQAVNSLAIEMRNAALYAKQQNSKDALITAASQLERIKNKSLEEAVESGQEADNLLLSWDY